MYPRDRKGAPLENEFVDGTETLDYTKSWFTLSISILNMKLWLIVIFLLFFLFYLAFLWSM